MHFSSFEEAVQAILEADQRYDREAYVFVKESWEYTVKMLKTPPGTVRHVTAAELIEGFRSLATEEFGPVAKRILNTWGIKRTEDVGDIVFNLVEKGFFGKQESDRKEDFADGFDFDEAFVRPFLPNSAKPKLPSAQRRSKRPQAPLK